MFGISQERIASDLCPKIAYILNKQGRPKVVKMNSFGHNYDWVGIFWFLSFWFYTCSNKESVKCLRIAKGEGTSDMFNLNAWENYVKKAEQGSILKTNSRRSEWQSTLSDTMNTLLCLLPDLTLNIFLFCFYCDEGRCHGSSLIMTGFGAKKTI